MKKLLSSYLFFAFIFVSCTSRQELTQEHALDFLYRYMPLPDMIDYDSAFYQRNVETSFLAREEMPWGKSVPEREFLHFVLPVRVNNENMDESRMVFYAELKDRVKGLSMKDAILEVNHWCHEKVTYTPSDERTSSPLASVKTAYGRCGEESTFTVAALRSVGIPARQVYTPRWAHTDDNHAWVEAWADGEWHFMGACEPEAVLDLGWFNAPASRGLLMHTKVFGNYDGPEEVMSQTECYTEINVTKNYAPVGKAFVKVLGKDGNAVEGANVEFKIYNYAEFYTVSNKLTDAEGITSLEAGLGDLLAWGYKDNVYGFTKCSIAKGDTAILVLDKEPGKSYSLDMEIIPPMERNTVPTLSDEQIAENARRLAYEDSLRNVYIATFDNSTPILTKSRGNHKEIKEFLEYTNNSERANSLLNVISDKDLRDISFATLKEIYDNTPENAGLSADFYNRYILNPRVANEMVLPYRAYFNNVLTEEQKTVWKADVSQFISWINGNIKIDEVHNPQNLRMLPTGVWKSRLTDTVSRNIFFVAVCRTLGLPARIDPVTSKVQYADADYKWIDVNFDAADKSHESNFNIGCLKATYTPNKVLENPKYYTHFTISAIKEGSPVLMNYAEEDNYESLLKNGSKVDACDYLLVTGTRMANGGVLVHIEIFPVEAGKEVVVPLKMREDTENLTVIGSFNSENLYKDNESGVKSILSTTGRGYFIIGVIAPNNEPTNHILRDIAQYKDELEQWGRKIVFVFRNQSEADRFDLSEFPPLPSNVVFGVDSEGQLIKEMSGTLPVVKIADTFNRVVYVSEGYTIGLGENLTKAIGKL